MRFHLSVSKPSTRFKTVCQATPTDRSKSVLILGGTGRVGTSTAISLERNRPDLDLILAGRDPSKFKPGSQSTPLQKSRFLKLDIDDSKALKDALKGIDLVIHTAGPFQKCEKCTVLEAALEMGTPYLDVCDDMATTQMAKQLHSLAIQKNVPAIVGGGVYPGLSNVMAAHIISSNKNEYDENGFFQETQLGSDITSIERIRYSYFTAGSGGAGKTLLVTSLMLLGEPVVAFRDEKSVIAPPMSQPALVDFGPGGGLRNVYLLNLPEVFSARTVFGAKSVSARFGTAPEFWNWLLQAMARTISPDVLQNRTRMTQLASLTWPITRFVDSFVGESVAMRVDIEFDEGKAASGIYYHERLSQSLGSCVGAFARCILDGNTEPGVWYPEQKEAIKNRKIFLNHASEGCRRLILNRPAWQIESEPKRIGLGMYFY